MQKAWLPNATTGNGLEAVMTLRASAKQQQQPACLGSSPLAQPLPPLHCLLATVMRSHSYFPTWRKAGFRNGKTGKHSSSFRQDSSGWCSRNFWWSPSTICPFAPTTEHYQQPGTWQPQIRLRSELPWQQGRTLSEVRLSWATQVRSLDRRISTT